jgi:pSer/pThr/pTyr-binding forkhead associated (FHA) protein
MDVFERFSSKFGQWYEGLFGAGTGELRPRDVLRKITTAMEDNRKEGFDGKIYVPNRYVLELAVEDPEERDYLLNFLDEEELVSVLQRFMAQNHYHTRGPLDFTIAEIPAAERGDNREKLRVKARFEKGAVEPPASEKPVQPLQPISRSTAKPGSPLPSEERAGSGEGQGVRASDDDLPTVAAVPVEDDEDRTVPAVAYAALAVTDVEGRKSHHSLTKQVTTIGRSRTSGNDIVLSGDGMVSKQHARIEREPDGRFTIYDLGSTNGVTVNQARIDGNRTLADGDAIVIGATRLVFQQAGVDRRAPEAPAVRPSAVNRSASGVGAARLISSQGDDYVLGSDTLIGRGLTADFVLDDPSVSTRHARIVSADPATYYLEDLGSEHGTKINGHFLPPHQRALLADGDVVVFGTRVLQFAGGRR